MLKIYYLWQNKINQDVHEKENENTINDEQLDNSTEFDAIPVQRSSRVAEKQSTKSSQTFPKIVKPKNKSTSIEDILASSKSTNVSSESISNVAITGISQPIGNYYKCFVIFCF